MRTILIEMVRAVKIGKIDPVWMKLFLLDLAVCLILALGLRRSSGWLREVLIYSLAIALCPIGSYCAYVMAHVLFFLMSMPLLLITWILRKIDAK